MLCAKPRTWPSAVPTTSGDLADPAVVPAAPPPLRPPQAAAAVARSAVVIATASPRRTAGRRIRQAGMGISRPALDETAAARPTLLQATQTAKRGQADPVAPGY